MNDIVLPDQFGGDPAKGWRKHAFADARNDRHTNDLDAVHHLFKRKGGVVLVCHHSHLVTAFDECAREAFGINGESAGVRTIIG